MAGVSIKDLPQNLQAKLKPYLGIAKDVDAAIRMAQENGAWTKTDSEQLNALNGSKAWGSFDGFIRQSESEVYKNDLAYQMKKNPVNGMAEASKNGIKRDVQEHPEKYQVKFTTFKSGRYIAYQKNPNTGKYTYKFYDEDKKEISEAAFKAAENVAAIGVKKGKGDNEVLAVQYKEKEATTGEKILGVATGILGLGLFASCKEGDEYHVYNGGSNNNNIINMTLTEKSSLDEAFSEMLKLMKLQAEYSKLIAENTGATAESSKEIKQQLALVTAQLESVKNLMVTIITNQENNAKTAEEYYNLIIDAIGNNSELLQIVIDKLAENNSTLYDIKLLLQENNTDNKDILQAITQVKYGIDVLHADQQEIKTLLGDIRSAINKLPETFKQEFGPYFSSILSALANGNTQLTEINSRLRTLVNLGNSTLEKIDKLIEIGEMNNVLQTKTNSLINEVLDAIKNLPNYKTQLEAIIDSINTNSASLDTKLDDLTNILKAINDNVVEGNATNKQLMGEILNAIKDLDTTAAAGFKAVITAIGNKTQQGVDLTKIEATLSEILDAIKNHKVEITVDINGHFTCTCCGNDKPNEGIIDDLEWLLG